MLSGQSLETVCRMQYSLRGHKPETFVPTHGFCLSSKLIATVLSLLPSLSLPRPGSCHTLSFSPWQGCEEGKPSQVIGLWEERSPPEEPG